MRYPRTLEGVGFIRFGQWLSFHQQFNQGFELAHILAPLLLRFTSRRKRVEGARRSQEDIKNRIMEVLDEGEVSTQNLLRILGYSVMNRSVRAVIQELIQAGKMAYTIPGQPNNRNQKIKKT